MLFFNIIGLLYLMVFINGHTITKHKGCNNEPENTLDAINDRHSKKQHRPMHNRFHHELRRDEHFVDTQLNPNQNINDMYVTKLLTTSKLRKKKVKKKPFWKKFTHKKKSKLKNGRFHKKQKIDLRNYDDANKELKKQSSKQQKDSVYKGKREAAHQNNKKNTLNKSKMLKSSLSKNKTMSIGNDKQKDMKFGLIETYKNLHTSPLNRPLPLITDNSMDTDNNIVGTAELEIFLRETKMKDVNTTELNPTLNNILNNILTKRSFEEDPLLTLLEIQDSLSNNTANHKRSIDDKIESSIQHMYTKAQTLKNRLQQEFNKAYKKVQSKVSPYFHTGPTTTHYTKITTNQTPCMKAERKFKKIDVNNTKEKTTIKETKPTKSRAIQKHLKTSKSSSDKFETTNFTISTAPYNDYKMLTILEEMLKKSLANNEIYVTTPVTSRYYRGDHYKFRRGVESSTDDTEYNDNNNKEDAETSNGYNLKSSEQDSQTESSTNYEDLSNKIANNEFVDGYRYYLNYQKEQGQQNFSNLVRYQAHKHHSVDDIGKYILNKIPTLSNHRQKRLYDDDNMDDQDVSTKSDDSWFKKHFYIFIDNGPRRKFHTSQTVELKSPIPVFSSELPFVNISEANKKEVGYYAANVREKRDDTEHEHFEPYKSVHDSSFIEDPMFKRIQQHTIKQLEYQNNRQEDKPTMSISKKERSRRNLVCSEIGPNNKVDKKGKNYGYVDVNLIPRPTAIMKLKEKKPNRGRLTKFFRKLHFHKTKKCNKKDKRDNRVLRFNPFRSFKNIINIMPDSTTKKMEAHKSKDYDTAQFPYDFNKRNEANENNSLDLNWATREVDSLSGAIKKNNFDLNWDTTTTTFDRYTEGKAENNNLDLKWDITKTMFDRYTVSKAEKNSNLDLNWDTTKAMFDRYTGSEAEKNNNLNLNWVTTKMNLDYYTHNERETKKKHKKERIKFKKGSKKYGRKETYPKIRKFHNKFKQQTVDNTYDLSQKPNDFLVTPIETPKTLINPFNNVQINESLNIPSTTEAINDKSTDIIISKKNYMPTVRNTKIRAMKERQPITHITFDPSTSQERTSKDAKNKQYFYINSVKNLANKILLKNNEGNTSPPNYSSLKPYPDYFYNQLLLNSDILNSDMEWQIQNLSQMTMRSPSEVKKDILRIQEYLRLHDSLQKSSATAKSKNSENIPSYLFNIDDVNKNANIKTEYDAKYIETKNDIEYDKHSKLPVILNDINMRSPLINKVDKKLPKAKNTGKASRIQQAKPELAKPVAMINKSPEQHFSTPLPMNMAEFNKFLKENQIDVESVTMPLSVDIPELHYKDLKKPISTQVNKGITREFKVVNTFSSEGENIPSTEKTMSSVLGDIALNYNFDLDSITAQNAIQQNITQVQWDPWEIKNLNQIEKPRTFQKRHVASFTAKDVAAIEVLVDLVQNVDKVDEQSQNYKKLPLAIPSIQSFTNTSFQYFETATNAIQLNIAILHNLENDKKRSSKAKKVKKIITAHMDKPVDLVCQVQSFAENNRSAPRFENNKAGTKLLYLLVDSSNTSIPNGAYALKPIQDNDTINNIKHEIQQAEYTTVFEPEANVTLTTSEEKNFTLDKDFIAAVNKHLVKLYESLTSSKRFPKEHKMEVRKAENSRSNLSRRRSINWENVKNYLGHNIGNKCKCKANHTMCRNCAESDAVISELLFYLDSLTKYMTDHCTEIQTFFNLNPTGGKKLLDSVHNVDRILRNYFRRVKCKNRGHTCNTCNILSTGIDKRSLVKQNYIPKKYIGRPLNWDVNKLARDVDTNTKYEKFKQSAKRLHNFIHNCVIDTPSYTKFNKRQVAKEALYRNIYSLDGININIISNPNATTKSMVLPLAKTTVTTPMTKQFTENKDCLLSKTPLHFKYYTLNSNLYTSTTHMLPNKNNKRLFSNFFTNYFRNRLKTTRPVMRYNKRQTQIETPLISDTGGSFWHDYLNGKNIQLQNITDFNDVAKPLELIETSTDNLRAPMASLKDSTKNVIERDTNYTGDTVESLSNNLNKLFKIFPKLQRLNDTKSTQNKNQIKNKITSTDAVTFRSSKISTEIKSFQNTSNVNSEKDTTPMVTTNPSINRKLTEKATLISEMHLFESLTTEATQTKTPESDYTLQLISTTAYDSRLDFDDSMFDNDKNINMKSHKMKELMTTNKASKNNDMNYLNNNIVTTLLATSNFETEKLSATLLKDVRTNLVTERNTKPSENNTKVYIKKNDTVKSATPIVFNIKNKLGASEMYPLKSVITEATLIEEPVSAYNLNIVYTPSTPDTNTIPFHNDISIDSKLDNDKKTNMITLLLSILNLEQKQIYKEYDRIKNKNLDLNINR
ncbi:hypothetical protein ACJJTC_003751 [Scirpophaga incertulas]